MKLKSLSCVHLLGTPWTAVYQAPLSMGFSRQEYCSGGAIAFSCYCINVAHSKKIAQHLELLQYLKLLELSSEAASSCEYFLYAY